MPPTATTPTTDGPDRPGSAGTLPAETTKEEPGTSPDARAADRPVLEVTAPGPRRRRRLALIIAAILLVAAATGAALAARAWSRGVDERLSQAHADMTQALTSLTTALDHATDTLESSADRIPADDTTRDALTAAVDAAAPLTAEAPDPDASRQDRTAQAADIAARADATTVTLVEASSAVAEAVAAWELDQAVAAYDTALTDLAAGIEQGRSRLSGSEGTVLDDAVRVALSAAIDAAETARATDVDPEDADALAAATSTLREHTDALSTARKAVADAQTAWQVEQDRRAAERAASAAAQSATTSGGGTGSSWSSSAGSASGSSRGSSSSGGTSGPGSSESSGSTGATSGSSGGGTWVESGSDTWCDAGDTSGAEGSGGWC